ncbi:ceramidase domain-containing protein [uncultured Roseibium sp.]|uniref:ceramidase domain-containing protein n=1 Tax=uncultured Roseibium sp. TaxID=1936171 RepID=UPI002630C770|nr:ceramidase domain-containing protein [uncultured Roseibium sp.]
MDLTQQLNNYCERVGPEFWSEPLNAITNAAFLIAAVIAFLIWRKKTPDDWTGLALIVILAAIGIGSFLFHTFATVWAVLADVIPIVIFIHVYLFFALNRFLKLPWWAALGIVIAFLVATVLFADTLFAPFVGSSAGYVPALLAIFVVGSLFSRKDKKLGAQVLLTGLVFLVSLTFRTLDEPLCAHIEFGIHFMWHILNAVVLFLLIRVLIFQRAG